MSGKNVFSMAKRIKWDSAKSLILHWEQFINSETAWNVNVVIRVVAVVVVAVDYIDFVIVIIADINLWRTGVKFVVQRGSLPQIFLFQRLQIDLDAALQHSFPLFLQSAVQFPLLALLLPPLELFFGDGFSGARGRVRVVRRTTRTLLRVVQFTPFRPAILEPDLQKEERKISVCACHTVDSAYNNHGYGIRASWL